MAELVCNIEIMLRGNGGGNHVPIYFEHFARDVVELIRAKYSTRLKEPAVDLIALADEGEHALRIFYRIAFLLLENRFVSYGAPEDRFVRDALRSEFAELRPVLAQGVRAPIKWRGLNVVKSVYDFATIPMVIEQLKPRAILELGSGDGGSAVWLADICRSFALSTRIISLDKIDLVQQNEAVQFVCIDMNSSVERDRITNLDLPHPLLVIEDCHQDTAALLQLFHDITIPGDYIIVEDSQQKLDAIYDFMSTHEPQYVLDTFFLDYFGPNFTSAVNGILKRVCPGVNVPLNVL